MLVDLGFAVLNFFSIVLWFIAAASVCVISVAGWIFYGRIFGSGVSSDSIKKALIWGAAAFVIGLLAVQGVISINEVVNKQSESLEQSEENLFTR